MKTITFFHICLIRITSYNVCYTKLLRTILTDVTQDMTIVHEESFGPILPVLKFKTYDEVIGYANDCEYGLAAMVYTNDMNRIMQLNRDLEFGEIYINRGHGELHQGFHNGYKLSGSGGEA